MFFSFIKNKLFSKKGIFIFLFFSYLLLPLFASESTVPDIVFTFQQPTYLTDKNPLLSEFTCDITKSECRVNFDLSLSFTGSFHSSDFVCLLDFGLGNLTGEEAKCNPNTVIFTGSSDYTVRFKIIQKTDPNIFLERVLIIHSGYLSTETFSGILSDSGTITDSGTLDNSGVLIETGALDNSGVLIETSFLVSSGNIFSITDDSAVLSGIILSSTNLTGTVYYGTGELILTDVVSFPSFTFSGLLSDMDYSYRIGFVPLVGSGEILSDTGTFRTLSPPKPVPDIIFSLQQPSYFTDKNPVLSEFMCDITESDCKVNFDLSPSFTGSFHLSDFLCSIDFGLENPTGEEGKCNPNTIVFTGSSDSIVHFRIIKKTDSSIFSERTIVIHRGFVQLNTSSGTLSNSGILDNSGVTMNTGTSLIITEPEIVIQSGIDSGFKCTKIDCIINLEYIPKDSKEMCFWSFSGGTYSAGTENNCNPGYIHYPVGNFIITLRVYEKGNTINFREKTLPFTNTLPIASSVKGGGISSSSSVTLPVYITDPTIVVQSGLDEMNYCIKTNCSINLEYKVLGSKEMCHWDFPGGSYSSGTENKCNPGYVRYPIGEFLVKLRVYERGNIFNYRDKTLGFSNRVSAEIYDTKTNSGNNLVKRKKIVVKSLDTDIFSIKTINENILSSAENKEKTSFDSIKITLQGALSKNRQLVGDAFSCQTKTTCSVNFTAGKIRKNTVYFWDFGNGETFYGANPLSQKFLIGKYNVMLRILDTKTFDVREEYFPITVSKLGNIKNTKTQKITSVKTEKPLVIKGQDFSRSSADSESSKISPMQVSILAGILGFIFFGGIYIIVRRKGIFLNRT
ncbi:hypothetical protein GW819_00810 [Candidatus Gracilibacteria bacterium]|nr:hypothetical protein [Candidatus Gracilibacteria bacterium]OIO77440.1 MAG: hypothetical protein AUJ87_01240 [Candidatus Gracilibacteria bacterium CG1_02_38_174]PIQ10858.1 MAG: hypothetical protein COW68_03640 [Candidatus Gracilibacteria bacterium CG18_big_fil_WC_8_21_14_2_50_38_16]PIQ41199.1 MAG: hypothetical protein COW06_03770 [Candidatus Gracilibacteria bacterium CG12_big_fil_rev_8_21_14_0_65_38_15]PIZ01528.1 MAG: hypothetical protein COY60_03055 [Candidatus Gracilibacteria bacterium CG_4